LILTDYTYFTYMPRTPLQGSKIPNRLVALIRAEGLLLFLMAEKLENATWNVLRNGNDVLMDYMDGNAWLLKEGVDYQKLTAVRAALYKLADCYDIRVQTRSVPGGLQVRFVRQDGSPLNPPRTEPGPPAPPEPPPPGP
jgi:hypothetical protein